MATKVSDLKPEEKVTLLGWAHNVRRSGKKLVFVVLRDGSGYVQVCMDKECLEERTEESEKLKRECYLTVSGVVRRDDRAPYSGLEVTCTDFKVLGDSEGIDALNKESGTFTKFENRHLVLRGERLTKVMKIRSEAQHVISDFMRARDVTLVTPPTLTQQEVEGGSTLFKLDYYGEEAVLTQSSQLYLETAIPSLGPVYCVLPSFRNEKSATRRHLSEFTHVEAELPSICFDDLLNFIEDMVVYLAKTLYSDPKYRDMIDWLYKDSGCEKSFEVPKTPFRRMKYSDAILWLNENKIPFKEDDGSERAFEYGDDIPEAPERKMTDMIGEPIFLTHFPRKMKAFYMEPDPKNPDETLSVDLLLPNVGEIVGGSMRITDLKTLEDGFKAHNLDTERYSWYIDQRRYGTCPHGGFGFGTERFLMWLTMQDNVKDCCLYPRYMGRIQP